MKHSRSFPTPLRSAFAHPCAHLAQNQPLSSGRFCLAIPGQNAVSICVEAALEGVAKHPLKHLFYSAALRTPLCSFSNKINHLQRSILLGYPWPELGSCLTTASSAAILKPELSQELLETAITTPLSFM